MITLFSPAKVNLFLRVERRREDGYHELSSLFQAIDLGDFITLTQSSSDLFTTNSLEIPCDPSNLVMKALDLFRKKTGRDFHVHIHLQKQIPIQAGLGGGSSNAATTLWGLNALMNNPASETELMQWGAELGSDVPFFFSHGTAHCKGRGEIVEDLKPLVQSKPLWLIKPPVGLSTPAIYRSLDLTKCSKKDELFVNDLEHPAFNALPSLHTLKEQLSALYDRVVMTGSGTAFICEGEHSQGERIFFLNRHKNTWYQKN